MISPGKLARALLLSVLITASVGSAPLATAQVTTNTPLPEVDGWQIASALLVPRSEQAVAELDGTIYVLGGYPPGRVPSDVVQVFDTADNSWEYGPSLPIDMHHVMATAVGGKLYLIGGEFGGAGSSFPTLFLDTVYVLDPAAGAWEPRASMPTGRSAGGTAVIGTQIYVAGGRPPRSSDFAVYDTLTDTWTVLPDLPTPRDHLAAGAIGGKVYVAGGRFGGNFASPRTAALEIFDPTTNTWSSGPSMPAPRGGVASVVGNGCLFVIGGEGEYTDPRGLSVENEAFNPTTNSWVSLPSMPTPTHGLVGAAFVDGRVHLPGGSITLGGGSGSVIHWTYRPDLTCE